MKLLINYTQFSFSQSLKLLIILILVNPFLTLTFLSAFFSIKTINLWLFFNKPLYITISSFYLFPPSNFLFYFFCKTPLYLISLDSPSFSNNLLALLLFIYAFFILTSNPSLSFHFYLIDFYTIYIFLYSEVFS